MGKQIFDKKRGSFFWFDPDELFLVTDKNDPLYDPRVEWEPNESLVKNIMYESQGVIEPVLITKRVANGKDIAVVVAGRQRTKAAKEAKRRLSGQGKKTPLVPCLVKQGDSAFLNALSISENEQRIMDSPIDKARKINGMLNFGQSWDDICVVFGCSKQTAKSYLELLSLPTEEKEAVHRREMPVKVARKRAKIKQNKPEITEGELSVAIKKDPTVGEVGKRRRVRTYKEVCDLRVEYEIGGISLTVAEMFAWLLHEEG